MAMDSAEDFSIVKRKRTKRRHRPLSPFTNTTTSSSSSDEFHHYDTIPSPPTSSCGVSDSTEEEEDMANCLILLAQGVFSSSSAAKTTDQPETIATATTTATTAASTKTGLFVYECKTCNRTFPSFQALGGHRASHKRPKSMLEDNHTNMNININSNINVLPPLKATSTTVSTANKSRVHECSICGSEFSSGQALGGHMRRHRSTTASSSSTTTTSSTQLVEKPRNLLSLDLNLPAPPEDDQRESSKFQFAFSAMPLVDCYY